MNSRDWQPRNREPVATLGRNTAGAVPAIEQITVTIRLADGSTTTLDMPKPQAAELDVQVDTGPCPGCRPSPYSLSPYCPHKADQADLTLTVQLNQWRDCGESMFSIQLTDPPDTSRLAGVLEDRRDTRRRVHTALCALHHRAVVSELVAQLEELAVLAGLLPWTVRFRSAVGDPQPVCAAPHDGGGVQLQAGNLIDVVAQASSRVDLPVVAESRVEGFPQLRVFVEE
ncbi:hypothetical protein [Nonomuraea cavernae]|uniref:hypothetical protein n=1 Tax=Nonomuraea cavernae TaxID=2045107 RepID=UPI0033FF905B